MDRAGEPDAVDAVLDIIKEGQAEVDRMLNIYDSTPWWRWLRRRRVLVRARRLHQVNDDLLRGLTA